jgi:hypothetical protein
MDKDMTPFDKQRAEAQETICIGIIATEMGYANQTRVCNAGRAVFKHIGSLTYEEFGNIKKLMKEKGVNNSK